jgi:Phosphotransferase enzyme family
MLTNKHKSSVFRLEVDGWSRPSVIAKWCSSGYGTATEVERRIHEQILPSADLSSLEVYAQVPDPSSDRFWLFLEDLGDRELAMTHVDERRLFSRWLGWLHRWTCGADCGGLPDRSPAAYLQHLRSASQRITENVAQPWVDEDARAMLTRLSRLLDCIERHWDHVEDVCGTSPRTIVHGDLVTKNVRIRDRDGRPEVVVLDWEMVGVGVPCVDLKLLGDDLDEYVAVVQPVRPVMSTGYVRALAAMGQIFRSLLVLDWKTYDFAYSWCDYRGFESLEGRLDAAARCLQSGTRAWEAP